MHQETSWTRKAIGLGAIFFLLLVPLALIPILAGWVGDIAQKWITNRAAVSPGELWLLGLSLIGLLGAAVLVVWKGRKLLPPRVLAQLETFEPRQVVIVLLSPCASLREAEGRWEVQHSDGSWIAVGEMTRAQLAGKTPELSYWPWQQTLRAAHYHGERLRRLVLVGSKGTKGSGTRENLRQARAFFDRWFPGQVVIYGEPQSPAGEFDARWQADFENLEEVSQLLRRILRDLHRSASGFTDRDIVIDCTSGTKVASIAAAMVTLDRPDLMFQYVGTADHAGEVIGFDVATEYYGT